MAERREHETGREPEAERKAGGEFKGEEPSGRMTVGEAGHRGGQRVRELIEEGKEKEAEEGGGRK